MWDEDGWLMPDYPLLPLSFLHRNEDSTIFLLEEWMLNDGGPGSKVFDARRWAVELGCPPWELGLCTLFGVGLLTQLSTLTSETTGTVCQKLDAVILQEGTAEQQSLYLMRCRPCMRVLLL